MVPPGLDHLFERSQARSIIGAHSLHIDAYDQLEIRKGPVVRFGIQNLVDLFLITAQHETRAAMIQHEGHLVGHRILIQRHRHRPAHLRRDHPPVMGRPVAPDDGDAIARPQPKRQQAKRQRTEASSSAAPARIVGESVFDRLSLSIAPELMEKP